MERAHYFAYGSNMQSATLRGRRGIEFRSAAPAQACGWRLVFDKPPLMPMGEAFANIIPDASGTVTGVLYEVGADDLVHIDLTEGVLIGNYQRVATAVQPLAPAAASVTAFTLTSEQRDPALLPSTHYMELLIAGALEHGLPAEYIDFLRAVPACQPSAEALRLRAIMDEFLRRG
jgi:gamma-glutamylcyclotransferase